MTQRTSFSQGASGFTLIEIIAVLVLIGVLAAVVLPRYMVMIGDAKNKAASQAVAEGVSRVSQAAASYILTSAGNTAPSAYSDLQNSTFLSPAAGDYTLTFASGGSKAVSVTADGTTGNALGSSAVGTAQLPQ